MTMPEASELPEAPEPHALGQGGGGGGGGLEAGVKAAAAALFQPVPPSEALSHMGYYKPAVSSLRQRLATLRAMLPPAASEPAVFAWMAHGGAHGGRRFVAPAWQQLLAATSVMVARWAGFRV